MNETTIFSTFTLISNTVIDLALKVAAESQHCPVKMEPYLHLETVCFRMLKHNNKNANNIS